MYKLSEPYLIGNENKYLQDCVKTNWLTSGGKYVNLFEEALRNFTGARYVVSCVNGTAALHLSLKMLGIRENDEVIVPTITFIATINTIVYNKAKPIFMDVDNFYNIDPKKYDKFIKQNTYFKHGKCYNKLTGNRIFAVMPVHVWGNAVNIEGIVKISKKNNIKIIEDASESIGTYYNKGRYKNRHAGTIGDIGCISFNGNKLITSGGGGAILTENKSIAAEFKYLINQAKNDSIFYIHKNIGYNYTLSNVHAAIGLAQLEKIEYFLTKRKKIRKWYEEYLGKDMLNPLPDYANNNNWLNLLKFKNPLNINQLNQKIKILFKHKIETRPVWQLNHLQKMFNKSQKYNIKNAYNLYFNSLCLPSSSSLKKKDINYISKKII